MRRIVMFNRVSADGYFAAPDGNLNWVVPEPDLDRSAVENMPHSDTILFGRKTYQMFEGFWRDFDPSASSNPHGEPSPEMHAMAKWINEATKIVFSETLQKVTWRNARVLHEIDGREIEAIKRAPGKDIMIFGSGSIVSQLTSLGSIDEYQLVVTPTLLGSGRPLFVGDAPHRPLTLVEAKSFASGNVRLRYVPAA